MTTLAVLGGFIDTDELPPLAPSQKWDEVPCDMRSALFVLFTDFHRNEGHSEASITAYKGDIRDFFTLCPKAIDEIEMEDVDAATKAWRERGLSPKTISRRHAALSSFFHCLQRLKMVKANPVDLAAKPKVPKRLPKNIPTEDETMAMCAVPGLAGAVCEILFGTGARRAELAGAKVADYDAGNGTIRIVGKGNKEAYLMLTKRAQKRLEEIAIPGAEYLVCFQEGDKRGQPLGKYGVYEAVLAARDAAGIDKAKRNITPHKLRGACATLMRKHGADLMDIQKKLRHASPATSQVYIDLDLAQQRAAQAKFHPGDRE